jgi:hypothetical protein
MTGRSETRQTTKVTTAATTLYIDMEQGGIEIECA